MNPKFETLEESDSYTKIGLLIFKIPPIHIFAIDRRASILINEAKKTGYLLETRIPVRQPVKLWILDNYTKIGM